MSRAALFTPEEDRPPYVISLQTDITARRNLEERLAKEATTDPLTGLLNRNTFMSHVQLALTSRSKAAVGLLFLDLDRFKVVNDTCGHDVGDEVLIRVARAMERVTRCGDVVARLGGDEFVVLCEGVDTGDDRHGRATRSRRGVRADRDRDAHHPGRCECRGRHGHLHRGSDRVAPSGRYCGVPGEAPGRFVDRARRSRRLSARSVASRAARPGPRIIRIRDLTGGVRQPEGANVSTITAISSVRAASREPSTLPGCGPCTNPAGWYDIEPTPMPLPDRLMKSPAE